MDTVPLRPFFGSIRLLLLPLLLLGLQDPIRSTAPIRRVHHACACATINHQNPSATQKDDEKYELVLKSLWDVDGWPSVRLQFGEEMRVFELCCARGARDVRPRGFALVREVTCCECRSSFREIVRSNSPRGGILQKFAGRTCAETLLAHGR